MPSTNPTGLEFEPFEIFEKYIIFMFFPEIKAVSVTSLRLSVLASSVFIVD
jgi:hypothetical protein